MKKFYVMVICCFALAGCSQDTGTQKLDLSSLNAGHKQTETNQKEADTTYNGEKGKEVLLKAFGEAEKDKAYEANAMVRFKLLDVEGTNEAQQHQLSLVFNKLTYKDIKRVDKTLNKAEGVQEVKVSVGSNKVETLTLYVYENNDFYVFESTELKSLSDLPNGSLQKAVSMETKEMSDAMRESMDMFAFHKQYIQKTKKENFATKQLTADDKEKGYEKAIAVKVDGQNLHAVKNGAQDFIGQLGAQGSEIEQVLYVFWLDGEGKIKKVMEQHTMKMVEGGNTFLVDMTIENTYNSKQKIDFAIGQEKLAK